MKVGDKVLYTDENGKKFDAEVVRVIDSEKKCSVHILGTIRDAELISQDSCKEATVMEATPEPEKKEDSGTDTESTADTEADIGKEPSKSETPKDETATEGDSTKESSDSN